MEWYRETATRRMRTAGTELFEGFWGAVEEMRANPVGVALDKTPKYVASTTLTEPRWADTTVLSGDLAATIGRLKAEPGGELQVHGSGTLIRWLLGHDLVNEITLLIVPVVLGQGTRLFPDAGPDMALDLVESRADSKGIMIQAYRPAGRPSIRPAEARDISDAPGRPVPAWPRPAHAGNEKHFAGSPIIVASGPRCGAQARHRMGPDQVVVRSRCGGVIVDDAAAAGVVADHRLGLAAGSALCWSSRFRRNARRRLS